MCATAPNANGYVVSHRLQSHEYLRKGKGKGKSKLPFVPGKTGKGSQRVDARHRDIAWNSSSAPTVAPPPPEPTAQGDLEQQQEARWPSWAETTARWPSWAEAAPSSSSSHQQNPNEPASWDHSNPDPWGHWTPPDVLSMPATYSGPRNRDSDAWNDSSRYRQRIWTDPDDPEDQAWVQRWR